MENLVDETLEEYLKNKTNICQCERCIMDIKAKALNKLPAHYVATDRGYIYGKIEKMRTQFNVDVLKAVVEAVEIVSKNRRHD